MLEGDSDDGVRSRIISIRAEEWEQMKEQLAAARAALEAVEWVWDEGATDFLCPWCFQWQSDGHAPDCQRQAALSKMEDDHAKSK